MMGRRFIIAVVMLAAQFASAASALGDIYVKMNGGNDGPGGDGSSTTPYKTIHHAVGVATTGDIIRIKGGIGTAWDYSLANGEEFPLEPGPGVSIIGDETSRPSWPRLGGDVAGTIEALIVIDSSSGERIAGTISKLVFCGEDVAAVDSPIALKILATNGNEAGVTFENNTCERPHLRASGDDEQGTATISIEATNGNVVQTVIAANSIECSDRGGIEIVSKAGTGQLGSTGVIIEANAIFTQDEDESRFGIRWQGVDLDALDPQPNGSIFVKGNVIRPLEAGSIGEGVQILCGEDNFWGANSMDDNTIDGCSGNGVTFSSDGWDSSADAEITVFFRRNKIINNGGSGVLLQWDLTNHESDLGYGYIHFVAEGCLIAGNGDYGLAIVGLGQNSADEEAISEVKLTNCTIARNDDGGFGFSNLALGTSDPAAEMAEVGLAFRNLIVFDNYDQLEAEIAGISGYVLDVVYAAAWYSDWSGHPLASVPDPCDPCAGTQHMMNCDPQLVDSGGGDFHIEDTSPCLDVGNNDYVSVLFDLDRDNRQQDGDCTGGDIVDMGYDEVPEDC
jgi:hypothetical protein